MENLNINGLKSLITTMDDLGLPWVRFKENKPTLNGIVVDTVGKCGTSRKKLNVLTASMEETIIDVTTVDEKEFDDFYQSAMGVIENS